jgi:hypothetical protein
VSLEIASTEPRISAPDLERQSTTDWADHSDRTDRSERGSISSHDQGACLFVPCPRQSVLIRSIRSIRFQLLPFFMSFVPFMSFLLRLSRNRDDRGASISADPCLPHAPNPER